jgi:Lon protease-like protein
MSTLAAPFLPGTALKRGIHRVVNLSPLPEKMKQAIKTCAACGRRAAAIDAWAKSKLQKSNPKSP